MPRHDEIVAKAGEARKALRTLERTIAWARRRAEAEGALMVYGSLTVAKACAEALHRSLEATAGLAGEHLQTGELAPFSGGNEKPDDEPPKLPPSPPSPPPPVGG